LCVDVSNLLLWLLLLLRGHACDQLLLRLLLLHILLLLVNILWLSARSCRTGIHNLHRLLLLLLGLLRSLLHV
jgi:hypothetical protein